jgi:uncharacterized membrane protein YeaQ/YmgE (transglycosylase-associated protein family)
VTVILWILIGIFLGLLFRVLMPVPRDGGKLPPMIAGVCSACVGGGLAVILSGGGVIRFNPYSVASAVTASMYALFAFRCFAMRGSGRN